MAPSIRLENRLEAQSLLFLCCLVWHASTAQAAEGKWETYAVKEGVVYESRDVPGARFKEYRATTRVKVAPVAFRDHVWRLITESQPKMVIHRQVLGKTDAVFTVYDQIKAPVVSNRDAVFRIRKVDLPGDVFEIRYELVDGMGPPPHPDFVRLPVLKGGWFLKPSASGGTEVTYLSYSEPGGSVPAWMVRGAQGDAVIDTVYDKLKTLPRR